jgi:hypothetical protein
MGIMKCYGHYTEMQSEDLRSVAMNDAGIDGRRQGVGCSEKSRTRAQGPTPATNDWGKAESSHQNACLPVARQGDTGWLSAGRATCKKIDTSLRLSLHLRRCITRAAHLSCYGCCTGEGAPNEASADLAVLHTSSHGVPARSIPLPREAATPHAPLRLQGRGAHDGSRP